MISSVPSVSSVHVELDGRLSSTVGRTDETTKSELDDEITKTVLFQCMTYRFSVGAGLFASLFDW